MKEFIKKYYSILIPAFLVIVILIAVILYAMEYKNNRYCSFLLMQYLLLWISYMLSWQI